MRLASCCARAPTERGATCLTRATCLSLTLALTLASSTLALALALTQTLTLLPTPNQALPAPRPARLPFAPLDRARVEHPL